MMLISYAIPLCSSPSPRPWSLWRIKVTYFLETRETRCRLREKKAVSLSFCYIRLWIMLAWSVGKKSASILLKFSMLVCMSYNFYSWPCRSTQKAETWSTGVTQHGEEVSQGGISVQSRSRPFRVWMCVNPDMKNPQTHTPGNAGYFSDCFDS